MVCFDISGLFIYGWLLEHPWIDAFRRGSVYLQMPCLLLYLRHVCFNGSQFNLKSTVHLGLFVGFLGALFYDFAWLPFEQKQAFLQSPWQPEFMLFFILGELQFFLYIYLMYFDLKRYKKADAANAPKYNESVYRWLRQLTTVLLAAHFVAVSKHILVIDASLEVVNLMYSFVSFSALGVVLWFVLKALHNPDISRGPVTYLETKRRSEQRMGYVASAEMRTLMQKLELVMEKKKPFLSPDITLEQLAEMVEVDKSVLSTLLNDGFGETFYNYINKYRIGQAKLLLLAPGNQSVLDILFEIGFNSKSSFNTAFKKHAGVTPSAFRKAHGIPLP
ncbi:helix-turn-helix transcriptional regulator [Idiomarina ramblicola]|uniref:helix-turn-helix transcriptional regulator n=1 Tax=Idiomarina ramblicola TaxID=263724 RepID=UPI0013007FD3|nr:AraC family transcriptional regulator [Idiomarina ramblicola]